MPGLKQVHHIAIIATGYATNKTFYCDVLDFALMNKACREERDSWKGNLALNGQYVIELLSSPLPPCRPSQPEARGSHHLAFSVEDVEKSIAHLEAYHVECESVRIDPFTGKHFTFFNDPGGLPLELYEM